MDRYCYFSPKFVTEDELIAVYEFTHKIAKDSKFNKFTICVNNIQANQEVEKIFNRVKTNKLERYKVIVDRKVNVQLKTPNGLKKFDDLCLVLAIHPSQKLLKKLESNIYLKILVVVAEVPPNGICKHLEVWADNNNVERFEIKFNE